MPEYLAPGVYVEETSFRPKTIEGVGTSTAGFVGAARFGPTQGEPELLTSFSDFERIYGGLDQLDFGAGLETNYLAQAVRAFFEEGGKRLYVSRVANGAATARLPASPSILTLAARHPGAGGNLRVTFTVRHTDNLLVTDSGRNEVRRVQENDTVAVVREESPVVAQIFDVVLGADGETLELENASGTQDIADLEATDRVALLTVDVEVERPVSRPKRPKIRFTAGETYEGLAFHPSNGSGLTNFFAAATNSRRTILYVPLVLTSDADTGYEVLEELFDSDGLAALAASIAGEEFRASDLQVQLTLSGGTDGGGLTPGDYTGVENTDGTKTGLVALEDLEDIAIVAAPGSSTIVSTNGASDDSVRRAAQSALVSHATRMRYRIAVMDTPEGQTLGDVRGFRGQFDSTYGAMYYPWVQILDTVTEEELNLPPSGFVAGIYARNDVNVGVHKTPANEVVRLAIGFEHLLNKAQQDVLNPDGINCFRFFEGRGYRLWGGRTISSDGEFKYVSTRRYLAYLEASIDRGTQVFVFENNGPKLWNNVQQTVAAFLFNEWKSNRLLGFTPEQAYFVRCDLTTMTQNDLDNGRLICEVGVSLLKPAEFVIFRIGQKLLSDQ